VTVAAGADLRAALQQIRAGEHSVGQGRCPLCHSRKLGKCPTCGERSLHRVATWTAFSEDVCENGCSTLEPRLVRWQAEMREALYQLELQGTRA
jgi:hypothetical protein